jgi:hypothetical protein
MAQLQEGQATAMKVVYAAEYDLDGGHQQRVVVDGDGVLELALGDVLTVGPVGEPIKGWASLEVVATGWPIVAKPIRFQTGVSLESLVGLEARRVE